MRRQGAKRRGDAKGREEEGRGYTSVDLKGTSVIRVVDYGLVAAIVHG